MIKIQIDVNKISKDKLFKGKKGVYLNCVLIETPNSEFADYMVVEETTKEERDAGNKGTILGGGSDIKFEKKEPEELTQGEKDDLPF